MTTSLFDISADLDTPVSAYQKLKPFRPRFLLESVEGGERLARYSFIGSGWATIVTESVVCVALGIGALRVNGVRPLPIMATAKTLFAALVMIGIWLATERFMPWWVAVSIAGIGFFLALHFLQIDGPGGLRALAREAHMVDQQAEIDPSQLDPGRS